jgi:hypothetical protein
MGMIFKGPAFALYAIAGIWSFFICMKIVYDLGGFILSAVALFLAPFVLYLAPWYLALFKGDWFPVALTYGGTIVAGILYAIGEWIDGRSASTKSG